MRAAVKLRSKRKKNQTQGRREKISKEGVQNEEKKRRQIRRNAL